MAFLKLRQFSSNLSYEETATDSGGLLIVGVPKLVRDLFPG